MERFFVSRPIFAICIALAIVLLGAISIFDLSIEQYPDITPPVVEVTASYSGADAETVNDAVATPVAQSVMGVSDMLYMQSTSANDGSMVLQVVFDVGTDPDLDAIFTQNNVATSTALLPSSVVTQGVVTQKTMTGFLMVFALHSDGRYDNEFLSNYAYINLQNQLLKINGVGKVSIMGAGEYAMRIWVKPDLLNYYNVSLDELRAAVLAEGGIYPAGQFGAEPSPEGTTYTYTVTMPRQISTAEEFAAIVVKTTPAGEQIFLRDVADVALGSKSYGVASAFGEEPATLLVIYQEPGSNAVDVGNRVKAAIGRLSERFPDGVSCTTIVDSTESIRSGVEEIILTLILALVLVIAIIYLFIQDWRATLIPLVAIPVSLIGTFIFFPLLGFSINIISLLGLVLAIGLVVDDAIVVVEAAQVNIERGMKSRAEGGTLDTERLRRALAAFEGVKRRFEFYVNTPRQVYMDDYAHHPRELAAALTSVRRMFPGRRVTAVFQPHLYTRTRDFYREFAEALSQADEVLLLPIYPAREEPIEGIASEIIAERVTVPCRIVGREALAATLGAAATDVVVSFGAGNIDACCDAVADVLRKKA